MYRRTIKMEGVK
ncbi:Protein of unknown function [Bacillus wiedmannii]|nr:Protein of unknown function [Bacillus wiedmannii]